MKRTLRSALVVALAVLLGAPISAQQSTLRLPPLEHAQKGDVVVVTLRDGREITGEVGSWIDDVGFHVKPADGPAWLIHPEDIAMVQRSGIAVGMPWHQRPSRLTPAAKSLIALG